MERFEGASVGIFDFWGRISGLKFWKAVLGRGKLIPRPFVSQKPKTDHFKANFRHCINLTIRRYTKRPSRLPAISPPPPPRHITKPLLITKQYNIKNSRDFPLRPLLIYFYEKRTREN